MTGTEWFLLIVVVILVPLAIAVAVTLWTLEQARLRNKRNRPDRPVGVKRNATRPLAPGEVRRGRQAAAGAGEAAGSGGVSTVGETDAPATRPAARVSRETTP